MNSRLTIALNLTIVSATTGSIISMSVPSSKRTIAPSQSLFTWIERIGIFLLGGAIAFGGDAKAQIVPDNTLGSERSIVIPDTDIDGLPSDLIEGGAIREGNLFHSFAEFNIETGGSAYFANPTGIENILTRVTGENFSDIDGTLGVLGGANLFLINPNGIVFGENASLDVRGSFVGSTANGIRFQDNRVFSATNPQAPPLLSVNVPVGLQYGSNPGAIATQFSLLEVDPGQTLALAGGDVSTNGSVLLAPGGRVELAGAADTGEIELVGENGSLSLNVPPTVTRANIAIAESSEIDVAADGGGHIAVQANTLDVTGGSLLNAGIFPGFGFPDAQAGDIRLDATGSVTIRNSTIFNQVGVADETAPLAIGNSGNIAIEAEQIAVRGFDSILAARTFGEGNAGNVALRSQEAIEIDGSAVFAEVGFNGIGNSGNIDMEATEIAVRGLDAILATRTFGEGSVGDITLKARDAVSIDSGLVVSLVEETGLGDAGNINIDAGSLRVTNGAQIQASTLGIGNAGNVRFAVDDGVTLTGEFVGDNRFATAVFTSVGEFAVGDGGNIEIRAGSFESSGGAGLTASTRGEGNAGNISLDIDGDIVLAESTPRNATQIRSAVEAGAVGDGGEIRVTGQSLAIADGAQVTASVIGIDEALGLPGGRGDGGNIVIAIDGTIDIAGASESSIAGSNILRSGVLAETETGASGTAGKIEIASNRTLVRDGALISTETVNEGGDVDITADTFEVRSDARVTVSGRNTGSAGNLTIAAEQMRLDGARFSANTQSGSSGNINLLAQDLQLRDRSRISTDAGSADGGNISIETETLVAIDNSDITANAEAGVGGRVSISARGIFGTEFRLMETPQSDITATSELGPKFSGTVEITTPDVDAGSGLVELEGETTDVAGLIADGCTPGSESTFAITGRGGLPPSPNEASNRNPIWEDLRLLAGEGDRSGSGEPLSNVASSDRDRLVEARGWIVNDRGDVVLTAKTPSAIASETFLQNPLTCSPSVRLDR